MSDIKMDIDDKFSKLPELAKPTVYTIHLKPDLTTFKCQGSEVIDLEVNFICILYICPFIDC